MVVATLGNLSCGQNDTQAPAIVNGVRLGEIFTWKNIFSSEFALSLIFEDTKRGTPFKIV